MKPLCAGLPMLVLLVCSTPAWPWGPTGHRVVGRIAERHLSERAAKAVQQLLGQDSLAEVSTWADEIRADPDWEHTAPWHYVNIDDGETYVSTKKDPRGDIVRQMRHFESVLRDRNAGRAERAEALKWLVHLLGDMHQPLHVGRRADRGGNLTTIQWFGRRANLHQVWDSLLMESEKLSFIEMAEFIDRPDQREIAEWQSSDYLDWVRESLELRARVYDIGNGRVGYAYVYKNLPVVRLRLAQAGVRLAGLLNSIFR